MSRLIETHSARNPRLLAFYGMLAGMVLFLVGGLAYRQLFHAGLYSERERLQSQRRVILPGPRGNILDRDGRVLVGNRPRFSVVLNLAELRSELHGEYRKVLRNYSNYPKAERPTGNQLLGIARTSLAQHYLDRVNFILGRNEKIDSRKLARHFDDSLLLPFVLLDDLTPAEYARLIERLEVESPLQVYTSSSRSYPYGSTAAHVLGYIGVDANPVAEDFPGDDLLTFKMKGAFGRDGLELQFDPHLQGESGGAIYRVDQAGYKINPPLEKRLPVQGHNLVSSLDIDLQLAAEKAMDPSAEGGTPRVGAAVAIDVHTGEVLVMASKPDYDPLKRTPNLAPDQDVEGSGVWMNRAIQGAYPTGSTFKLITAIAGLRSGVIDHSTHFICPGYLMFGSRRFPCAHGAVHGDVDLVKALALSCNVFIGHFGVEMGGDILAAEARRFGYDRPTGIELPNESHRMLVADPAWKKSKLSENWYPGDSANMSIGQGFLDTTPLQVACMVASFARRETETKPSILHDPNRPTQHTTALGLSDSDYDFLIEGLEACVIYGTGKMAHIDGLRIAAKTGTAQKDATINGQKGRIELAWMIAFAPIDNPQVAVAVCLEGQAIGENYGGGTMCAPVVKAIFEAWKEKQERTPAPTFKVTSR